MTVHMLMGRTAGSRKARHATPTTKEVQVATERAMQAGFIGVHELWNMSMCLLWAKHATGAMTTATMQRTRPTDYGGLKGTLVRTLLDMGWRDSADMAVYAGSCCLRCRHQ